MREAKLRSIASKLGIKILNKHKGIWLMSRCPLAPWTHPNGRDNDPSFGMMINDAGNSVYHCFGCKGRGRVSSLIRTLEFRRGKNYGALALEADKADYDIELPTYEEMQAKAQQRITLTSLDYNVYGDLYPSALEYPEAVEYLANRGQGIFEDTILALDIRYDPDDKRVVFMVRDREGGLYGFTGRTILHEDEYPNRRYVRIKDYAGLPKEYMLLGAERVRDGLPVIVEEGLMGYASMIATGIEEIANVVGLLGSEMTIHKADMLCEWGLPVYLMVDNDQAGDQCLFGAFDPVKGEHLGGGALDKLKGNLPLFVPTWPEGKKDPDELTYDDLAAILRDTPPYI